MNVWLVLSKVDMNIDFSMGSLEQKGHWYEVGRVIAPCPIQEMSILFEV